ncbi:ArsR family transcriptional regulator [Salirhabdus euzebyi]|uniref:ArsR family transcriptional regulator n=1 Tax=Salirhabdus euzebyi TaxID=394506 RepID=A0A841PSL2_9BACI|nr:metalloregulator ArsR/SmtB family transcription factor [Salirhabdus euzebyi]MBB6451799.1 ArsR family transcriptional regulator [Salirhabdus euzebyi]
MLKQTIEMESAATILKLLGDKTRLTMVKILEHNDCCVCEFVALFQMSQPAISQHLRKLKDVGLVKEARKGQWIIYSLNQNSEVYPFVKHLLEQIQNQNDKLYDLEKKGLRVSCT